MVAMKLLSPNPVNDQLPLFIFLPGMDGSGQLLHRQVASLGRHFDLRCLALPVDDQSEWESLVEQVTELIVQERGPETGPERGPERGLERGDLHRPIYLCGESFGGCLALKLAAHRPELFQHLILVNPASSFTRLPWLYWGSPITDWLPEPLFHLSAMGLVPFLIEPERVVAEDRDALLRMMQSVAPQTAAWRLRLLRHFELDSINFSRLTMPVLLVAGGGDRLLPSAQEIQRIAQKLPIVKTHILAQSGHACLLEQDVNLSEILQQYESPIAETVWQSSCDR
jgi:pimeloyl-ACP methyl ester carboxylesterase